MTEAAARSEAIALSSARIELDLRDAGDLASSTYEVRSILRLRAREADSFLDIAGEVLSLRVDGRARRIVHEDERLLLSALPTDAECVVEVLARCAYSRTGEGLHRYADPADSRVYLYTQFEPNDAHRAWPCFDQPDMKARWTFIVDAPADWVIASNGALEAEREIEGGLRRVFTETEPLSSYITALVAGPWALVDGGVWEGGAADGAHVEIPLRLLCRRALARAMDAEDILAVTRAGLDFFHAHYGTTYPWGTYDQVFVPEYNLGAMENPGCVTFNERYLSTETPSEAERQRRANTILHEMCHMWFGDLVTPKWWDDLWLKESFAENQGAMAAARATVYAGERASFAVGRKSWALEQDEMPTTHPIASSIPDVGAAKTNFDGITYAKGAAVLDQLVAWVGEEAFFAGAREYFRRHAFSSATFADLLACLEDAAGLELEGWAQAWLTTSGPSILEATWTSSPSGAVSDFRVRDVADSETTRPHRLLVSGWALSQGRFERRFSSDIRMEGRTALVDPEGLLDRPGASADLDLVVVNDADLTYAVSRLDARSQENALAFIGSCPDLMTRCVVWASLWNGVRDGLVDPALFATAALDSAVSEEDAALGARLLTMTTEAISRYLPGSQRAALRGIVLERALRIARSAPADTARDWIRMAIAVFPGAAGADGADAQARLREWALAPTETGWLARGALAALGLVDARELEADFAASPSGEAARGLVRARAALPHAEEKERAWALITAPDVVNDRLSAAFEGLALSGVPGFETIPRALEGLGAFWERSTIGLSIRYVTGAFLSDPDIEDAAAGEGRLALVRGWLDAHEEAPAPLRRLLLEEADRCERSMRVQARWALR